MKKALSIIAICIICQTAFATGQHPDRILIKGDTLLLYSRPFEKADSARRNRLAETDSAKTGVLQHGYRGLWRLDKDTLRIEGMYNGDFKQEIPCEGIFRKGEAATWFSGDLRVVRPEEKSVYSRRDGLEQYFKHETLYTMRNGVRKSIRNYTNRMIGDNNVFYEQAIPTISKTFVFPPTTDSVVYQSIFAAFSVTPDKQGKIKEFDLVKMVLRKQDGTQEIVTDVFHPYLQELLRRLQTAEPYSITIHGKVRPITLGIPLKVDENAKKRP